jgi:hypothetical protein
MEGLKAFSLAFWRLSCSISFSTRSLSLPSCAMPAGGPEVLELAEDIGLDGAGSRQLSIP